MSKRKNKAKRGVTKPPDPSPDSRQLTIQQALDLAVRHHGAGQLSEAEDIYRQVLGARPDQPDALHLLGVIAHQSGQNDHAVELIAKALAVKPDYAEAHNNLGLALQQQGKLDAAAACYEEALAIKPDFDEAHTNLGNAQEELGLLDEAVASHQKALAIKPDDAELHSNLGFVLEKKGLLDEAAASHQKALSIKPDDAELHTNLGNVLKALGRLDEAVTSYRKTLALNPDLYGVHTNLGNVQEELGLLDEAAASHRKALSLNPDDPGVHTNLGNVLKGLGRLDEAAASHRKALALNPDFAEAHYNLGNALRERGLEEEAVESYRRVLAIKPDDAEAHNNLGNVLKELGRLDEAVASHRKAIAIKPDDAEAHHNLSLTLLLLGQMEEGWTESEWRMMPGGGGRNRNFPQAPWRGEPLGGKTILVWGEQGVGDEVLFAGMVPDLIDAGAGVVLECDPRLAPLYRRSFPAARCIARENPPAQDALGENIDFQVPSGGLGRWLRPDLESFPRRRSYLAADEDRRQALKERYGSGDGGLLVGIAWYSKNEKMGAKKSLSLGDLRPLAEVPGVTLVDLQYGDWADERRAFEEATGVAVIHDDGIDQMADLDAFAAQVAAMDLIVSISSTTVHFGGALGVPTWVLLNTVPLFVWMLERDDSPWYPSVKLFRQTRAGEWADVIGRVADALRDFSSP